MQSKSQKPHQKWHQKLNPAVISSTQHYPEQVRLQQQFLDSNQINQSQEDLNNSLSILTGAVTLTNSQKNPNQKAIHASI